MAFEHFSLPRQLRHVICALVAMTMFLSGSVGSPTVAGSIDGWPEDYVLPPTLFVRDGGINPYHEAFRVPAGIDAWEIPGYYPEEAILIDLSLDAPTYEEAVAADAAIWAALEYDTLYAFNGTRAMAIDFDPVAIPGPYPILDQDGHGSLVASSAVGARAGSCPECRIVVGTFGSELELDWARQRAWIDAASYSQSALLFNPEPTSDVRSQIHDWVGGGRSFFTAAGNGFGLNTLDPYSGMPGSIRVSGGSTPSQTSVRSFELYAHQLKPVARHDSLDEYHDGGGTSVASPDAAGHYLMLLWEARRILGDATGYHEGALARASADATLPEHGPLADGNLTADELERVVLLTADEDVQPQYLVEQPLAENWPPELAYFRYGYGMVDHDSVAFAKAVLRGEQESPEKPWADYWHGVEGYAREGWGGTMARCLSQYLDAPECLDSSTWSPVADLPSPLWPVFGAP